MASELIKSVFQKLASDGLKEIVRSKGIISEHKNLELTLTKIQNLLDDAWEKEKRGESVNSWLNNLRHLVYDIDDILDGLATDAMHLEESGEKKTSRVRKFIPTCCSKFSVVNQFSHELDIIATKLQDLEKEKVDLGLIVQEGKPKNTSTIYEASSPDASMIVGREAEKKKLLHKLLLGDEEACDQKFSIVPIVGMGGVGKTALARLLYDEPQVNHHFELKSWVYVSLDFDVFNLTKTIFQDFFGENKEFRDLNQLQVALRGKLKDKRFLLVLDDVWSEDIYDWEILVSPFHLCAPGSKIIITTRKEKLLKELGFGHLDRLESLSHGDALSLFAYHALGVDNFDSHPIHKPVAETFVKECGGLPLALITIGRALRTKENVEEWEVLSSRIRGLENKQNQIVPALKQSYNDLPACLKQLFAYCSLFPKDFMFDRDDLVMLWMAEGFLNQSIANKPSEHLGHEYFEEMLSRSFFLHSTNEESLYVMHDVINDLAMFVAGDYCLRFDNQMEIENVELVKYRHMSFITKEFVAYQKFDTFKRAKSLRTFLAVSVGVMDQWDFFQSSNKILEDLLPAFPLLRVLSLSCLHISVLPECIGSLKHLRYLNLSQTEITELPEYVCNLYNLQTLIIFGCHKLSKLPTSFLKLKNLRHFDTRDTPLLKKMPLGIDELYNLKNLTRFIIGGNDGLAVTELKQLKKLRGGISIEGLDKVENATSVRDINFSQNRLTELELKWSDVFDDSQNETLEKDVLSELKPHSDKLKRLKIMLYGGVEFPNWVGDSSFLQLVHVSISGCRKCTSLPLLAQLPSLKELYIEDMKKVKVVGLEFLGTTGVAFPSLDILRFQNMEGWEVWSTNSGDVFPRLRGLYIRNCPNLVEVSLKALPSLRVLEIIKCGYGVLRSIVYVALSVTQLYICDISGLTDEAWKGVMKYLGAVKELKVNGCDEIRYLWESEAQASKVLVNINILEVWSCSNLVSLGEKAEGGNCGSSLLISLRILRIDNCESMKHCIYPYSIESLSIQDCPSLESFPYKELLDFTSLKTMVIRNCPSINASFPGGDWPPELCTLEIGELNKPFSEWGDQKFPASLVNLQLYGGEDCTIHQLSGLLPPSLTSLEIHGFKNLKSVSFGLQHLTSLQHLKIFFCRNIIDLPETLLPSLLSLEIKWCPNLKKKIRGRGSRYRNLISQIPKIDIN